MIPRRGSKLAIRANPLSITPVTPSMVSDVSATFVATMTLRPPPGATAASWSAGGSSPCSGMIATLLGRRTRSVEMVREIS